MIKGRIVSRFSKTYREIPIIIEWTIIPNSNTYYLELETIVNSMIIEISLGISQSTDTIRQLIIALSFH